ncbi:MAG: CPBP family intramembrane metalloprotease [Paludibacteraceae bacterium]|nr:CPBP family intramembrane metalloprotease [Paludibacteraceae bacterium]
MRRERSAFFILFVWVLLMALGTTIAYFLWTILPDRNAVSSLKALQAMQVLFLFILPALAVAWLFQERPAQWLGLTTFPAPKVWLYTFLLMLVMVPGINLLSYWNQQLSLPACLSGVEEQMKLLEEKSAELLRQFMNTTTFAGFLVNLGLMALLPAIGEELTFRGVLLHTLAPRTRNPEPSNYRSRLAEIRTQNRTPHLAIWVTAIIFSFVHFQFYGFVPRMLMGALLGYMLCWTGSLWIAMLMHFTNNAIVTILYFICLRGGYDTATLDAIGSGDTLWLGILSIIVTVVGIYLFRRSLTMSNASSRTSSGS